MIRFLFYLIFFYVLWRIVLGVFHLIVGPAGTPRQASRRPHARDFSDVQEADFEDVTPPPDPKNGPTPTSTS